METEIKNEDKPAAEVSEADPMMPRVEALVACFKELKKVGKTHLGKGLDFGLLVMKTAADCPRKKFLLTLKKAKIRDDDFPAPSTCYYYASPLMHLLKQGHKLDPACKLKNLAEHPDAIKALTPELLGALKGKYSSFREFKDDTSKGSRGEEPTSAQRLGRAADRITKCLDDLDGQPNDSLVEKLGAVANKMISVIGASGPNREFGLLVVGMEKVLCANPTVPPSMRSQAAQLAARLLSATSG